MVNFGLLSAKICWRVWGTPANLNDFASWLRYCSDVAQRKPTKLSTTFGLTWAGRLHIHFRQLLLRNGILPVQNSFCILQVLRSPICIVSARQSSSDREPNFAALCKGRHLYSEPRRRPSGWSLAHILVSIFLSIFLFLA